MKNVLAVLMAAILAAILAARLLYAATAGVDTTSTSLQPWAQDSMQYVAWDHERWSAWIRGDKFELTPRAEGKWQHHVNTSLAFTDWEGQPWQAKIEGQQFLLAYRGDWKGRIERSSALRYRDWRGHHQVRTVAQLRR
jgi:hypothetical protein